MITMFKNFCSDQQIACLRLLVLWRSHHHLTELVEVHGAGPVLIDLGDDPVQVFLREVGVHLECDNQHIMIIIVNKNFTSAMIPLNWAIVMKPW